MHLCGAEGLLAGTGLEGHQRQLEKKQKNRASAQRSRQKHTDKADALHQQQESLEKHNHALRKEIRGLQAELAWWSRALHAHERLCLTDCASCWAALPADCRGQAQRPLDPVPPGHPGCQEQPGLLQTPFSSLCAQQLSPDPQPRGSPGLLLSPLPSLSLGPTTITAPPAHLSPGLVRSASPSGSSLLKPSSKLNGLLPSPSAQLAPHGPLGRSTPPGGSWGPHCTVPRPPWGGPVCRMGSTSLPSQQPTSKGWVWASAPARSWLSRCSPPLQSTSDPAPGTGLAPALGSGSSLIKQASPPLPPEAALLG